MTPQEQIEQLVQMRLDVVDASRYEVVVAGKGVAACLTLAVATQNLHAWRDVLLPALTAAHQQGMHDAIYGLLLPGAEMTAKDLDIVRDQVEVPGVTGRTACSVDIATMRGLLAHIDYLHATLFRMAQDNGYNDGLEAGRREAERLREALRKIVAMCERYSPFAGPLAEGMAQVAREALSQE